ncbi:Helix-turn-helix domain-containing protein, partial [Dysosmobacter welbionis]
AAVQSGVLLACLAAVAVLARQVFAKAFGSLLQKRCTSELLAVVSAVVMAADCVARLVLPERSAVPCYAPVGC